MNDQEIKKGEIHEDVFEEKEKDRIIENQKAEIFFLRRRLAELEGEVKGLKFAIRCDGVSGAEVSAND